MLSLKRSFLPHPLHTKSHNIIRKNSISSPSTFYYCCKKLLMHELYGKNQKTKKQKNTKLNYKKINFVETAETPEKFNHRCTQPNTKMIYNWELQNSVCRDSHCYWSSVWGISQLNRKFSLHQFANDFCMLSETCKHWKNA